MLLILTPDTLIAASFLLSMPMLNEVITHQLSIWTLSGADKQNKGKRKHRTR